MISLFELGRTVSNLFILSWRLVDGIKDWLIVLALAVRILAVAEGEGSSC